MHSINSRTLLVVLIANFIILLNGQSIYKLDCEDEHKVCTLISKDENSENQLRVESIKCVDDDCKDSITIADDKHWYICEHTSRQSGVCQRLFNKNALVLQETLLNILRNNIDSNEAEVLANLGQLKRALPFESLNYGRRKRALPFETLNYGKRFSDCDCSQLKRALPFESMLYGKRALPFETLNYGKRAYIPIDGYIMGKREDK